jgi:hypothetical protein
MMSNRQLPQENEVWQHFKNNQYKIIVIAEHTETNEQYVVYQALYGEMKKYIRPLDMFMSEVDHVKYPSIKQKYRFEKINSKVKSGDHL